MIAITGLLVLGLTAWYLHTHTVAVLEPRGPVGRQERGLLVFAAWLSALVVVPVFALTILIAVRYREGNHTPRRYRPDWDHSRILETIWWGIPITIITVLSVVTWRSSHALDPYKPLTAKTPALTIQVISLDWKWLFIYPAQQLASVNQLALPVNTPVDFQITSDSVMNSFWIPQLGSQIYAMPGMTTQLHLLASQPGNYYGSAANITGRGFAGMHFTTEALSAAGFQAWSDHARRSPLPLTLAAYQQLAKPSQNHPVSYYTAPAKGLFDYVVMKYMGGGSQ